MSYMDSGDYTYPAPLRLHALLAQPEALAVRLDALERRIEDLEARAAAQATELAALRAGRWAAENPQRWQPGDRVAVNLDALPQHRRLVWAAAGPATVTHAWVPDVSAATYVRFDDGLCAYFLAGELMPAGAEA